MLNLLNRANIVPLMEPFIQRKLWVGIVVAGMMFLPLFLTGQKLTRIRTVVIDAGHGGRDPGALGKHAREKDITLKVALKLGNYITQNLPDVKVIYTRKTDKFIELKKRGEIANKNNADVFISIHCNSNPSHSLYGAETYVLGSDNNRTQRNMKVAMLENASILLEKNAEDNYNGFDPKAPESYIVFTLQQSTYKQEQSLKLAKDIQDQFKDRVGRKDRGVHQAGFLVLAGTIMPSVLVELGYLSNPNEEKFLMSKKGQAYLASAIYRAFKKYKRDFEKENNAYEYRKEVVKKENAGKEKAKPVKPSSSGKRPEYRVQFYAYTRKIPVTSSRFKGIDDISVYFHNGLYKYTSGHFPNKSDAVNLQQRLRAKGFRDAFVVAFYQGKRISLKEAQKIAGK